MLALLIQWYRRRFSDPEAIALLVILLAAFLFCSFQRSAGAAAGGAGARLSAGVADRAA